MVAQRLLEKTFHYSFGEIYLCAINHCAFSNLIEMCQCLVDLGRKILKHSCVKNIFKISLKRFSPSDGGATKQLVKALGLGNNDTCSTCTHKATTVLDI